MAVSSETASLLRRASVSNPNGPLFTSQIQSYDAVPACDQTDGAAPSFETSWKGETKILARYSAPLVVTYVLQ